MKRTRKPTHPGKSVKVFCIEAHELEIQQAAKLLGISRQQLSAVINGHARITAEIAFRLAKVFGGSAEVWLRQQNAYDLWELESGAKTIRTKPLPQKAA
ncbi:MAG: HigA family addiction module antidote protein [Alphaproteobacteria bacterium]|nr:HigA family addiction module antidote protein [Alphaproteobacteria bacterium]